MSSNTTVDLRFTSLGGYAQRNSASCTCDQEHYSKCAPVQHSALLLKQADLLNLTKLLSNFIQPSNNTKLVDHSSFCRIFHNMIRS